MSPKAIPSDFVTRAAPSSGALPVRTVAQIAHRTVEVARQLTDLQVLVLVSTVLFAVGAWPLALVELPPYQDLPNHLATVTVIEHPELYPEFVFNGFLKTNSALFTWLIFVGQITGTKLAAKLFAMLVLALNSIAMPGFVLAVRNRRAMLISSLFVWPMVHNWFVSMGMLDFALSVPLALGLLLLLRAFERAPKLQSAAAILLLGAITWYAHVFSLLVVLLLSAIHVVLRATWRERGRAAMRYGVVLFVPGIVTLASLYDHVTEPTGTMTGFVKLTRLLPLWELAYNAWAEWAWGFSKLTITSVVPLIGLAFFAFRNRRVAPDFFSLPALLLLVVLYAVTPYSATNWFHVNSRLLPFIWLACLVRVPERLPRWASRGLVACAMLYSLGMGVDFVRLDRERVEFESGIAMVPERARLLPLIFRAKSTSENTRNLLHAWGGYVTEKHTSAPLLFAHSRSFPVMYREAPTPRFNHLVLETFAPTMANEAWLSHSYLAGGVMLDDPKANYRARWAEFWKDASPQFDHVLLWDAPEDIQAVLPDTYERAYSKGRLTVLRRKDFAGPVARD